MTLDSRSGVSAADNRSRFSGDAGEARSYALLPCAAQPAGARKRGSGSRCSKCSYKTSSSQAVKHKCRQYGWKCVTLNSPGLSLQFNVTFTGKSPFISNGDLESRILFAAKQTFDFDLCVSFIEYYDLKSFDPADFSAVCLFLISLLKFD